MNPQLFRYWIARLRPLATPKIWMSVLSVGAVGSFASVAYQNPEMLSFSSTEEVSTEKAEEDAIGADIDSLSVLRQEVGGAPALQSLTAKSKPNALRDGNLKEGAAADKDKDKAGDPRLSLAQLVGFNPNLGNGTPGATMTPTLLMSSSATQATPSEGNSLFQRRTSEAGSPVNRPHPLAQAIDRLMNPGRSEVAQTLGTQPILEGTSIVGSDRWTGNGMNGGINPVPLSGTTGITGNTVPMTQFGAGYSNAVGSDGGHGSGGYGAPYPSNAYTHLSGANAGYPTGNPGVVAPIAPTFTPPASGMGTGMVTAPMPLPNAGVPTTESGFVPIEQTFTAPRPIPNRVIGGGNINTFSNP